MIVSWESAFLTEVTLRQINIIIYEIMLTTKRDFHSRISVIGYPAILRKPSIVVGVIDVSHKSAIQKIRNLDPDQPVEVQRLSYTS